MISGIFIIVLMIAFFAIIAWAWSDKRAAEFQHLANLPLEDEDKIVMTTQKGEQNGND